ncbi:MAG: prepilin-type N-terminal cleavage/methylation domain-containing protein [Candidatus Paceibacterota bacterium]
MRFYSTQQGYSLVEVLVAVAVLLISIVGPLTIASKGLKNASTAKQQNTAFFLAQEGLESVVKLREDSALDAFVNSTGDVWSAVEALDDSDVCSIANPCGVDIENGGSLFLCSDRTCDLYRMSSGQARFEHNETGSATVYNRQIILSADSERLYVQSIVTWGEAADERVALSMYLYNIYEN